MKQLPNRGLVIRSPWIDRILSGEKWWELRSKPTQVQGQIGLIKGGSCTVVGTANIVGVLGPLDQESLSQAVKQGNIGPDEEFSQYPQTYAWVLDDVSPFPAPVPYNHPRGAITWVKLNNPSRISTESFVPAAPKSGIPGPNSR